MKSVVSLIFALCSVAAGQCPNTPSPHFTCTSGGGNTQITLFQDAELSWDRFDVPADGILEINSADGGRFSSRHLTPGFFRSVIAGNIRTDGPFTLVNSGGIKVTSEGSVRAPSITLSTLPAISSESYQGDSNVFQSLIDGRLEATSGDVTLLAHQFRNNGQISAPNGKVKILATGSELIFEPDFERAAGPRPSTRPSRLQNDGVIEAPIIEIYSEDFIENGGRIEGGRVVLEAGRPILHKDVQGSVIIALDLSVTPDRLLKGPLINPFDGGNPGGVSTTLGLPDLKKKSFSSKRKTTLLPAQYSSSTVSRNRVPSAISRKKKATSSRLATRGNSRKKKSSKKRSFFGIVTTK